jgi:hypothetical protein
MEQKIIPTWGYKSDGSAEIFDLEEGENLPEGWSDRPEPWHHPNTAHLYAQPQSNETEAVDMPSDAVYESERMSEEELLKGLRSETPPDPAFDMPPKPRRGRPRKSEI